MNTTSYEADVFDRAVHSYIQGVQRGSLRENQFLKVTFEDPPPLVTADGVEYVYRVVYYDIPARRWVELNERVKGDFNGNLLVAAHKSRISSSPASPDIIPDSWPTITYDRVVEVAEVGVNLLVFSGEHVSSHHNAGVWKKYKLFIEGLVLPRTPLRWSGMQVQAMPWFQAARTSVSSGLLFLATVQDITRASNGITPQLAVSLALDASGWAEMVVHATRFAKLAGPLGIFTLGFTIGYEIGGLAGLGLEGRILLGIALGGILLFGVILSAPILPVIIVAAAVTVILILTFKYLGW